jgi:hypothetical protein
MLPRLIINVGVAAVAAALAVNVARGDGYEHREYDLTITKSDAKYSVSQKNGFLLAYHGSTHWNVFNDTDDQVTFEVVNFQHDGGNDCPVDFLGNTGSTVNCIGSAVMAPRTGGKIDSDTIKVKRGDAYTVQKYTFDMKINGDVVDPDIELERDPYGFMSYLVLAGGIAAMLAGWWLGRKR